MKGLIIVVIIVIVAVGGFLLLRDGSDNADLSTDEVADIVNNDSTESELLDMSTGEGDEMDGTATGADTTPEVMVVK